ncbi:MAG: hypothetical protein ABI666_10710 [Ferruginibacter sp.]
MKKHFLLWSYFFMSNYTTKAQSVENSVNLYGTNFPQEKIHIHFDKEIYLPGETIWFKAYLFEENLPSERSTNFYAALYDENGKLIQEQLSPIFNSTTDGHFDIPDSLQSKQLICRAYTSWMMNFDTTFLFTKAIKLMNKNAKDETLASIKTVSLQFFPEGGDIIEGTRNTIAFKANYNSGLPFEIKGVLKKQETGEVVMELKSIHDGMGRFDVEMQANESFYAEWTDNNGVIQQTYLPKTKPGGVSLKLAQQKDKLVYNIVNKLPDDSLHVLMYMYQKIFYKTDLAVSSVLPYTGMVPVSTLPTGIMQLTVFNTNWQPVAERVAFINNNNYTLGITITDKEINTQKRGKNIIEIEVTDTISANMSLSVTDAELNNEETSSTIVTNLLLSGDVKGYIYNPAYYFADNSNGELKANLDLVMLTHGWRRYNWDDMLVQKMPVINYPPDNYLSAYGQISKDIMDKMTTEENVNLIIKTKDSTNNFYAIRPDNNGLLKQEGLIFYDTARVLFSFNKNKSWNTKMAFSTSNYTFNQPQAINNYRDYFIWDTTGYIKFSSTASLFNYYNTNKANQPFNKEKTLQGVVVKSNSLRNWKNNPLLKMDEKYTSGLFRGGATSEAFDLLHDEMAEASGNIINYLKYRSGMLGRDKINPPLYFIDEHIAEYSEVEMLWISNIAYVKIIRPYFGTRNQGGDLGTAVSIYLKKGNDLIDRRPKDTDLKLVNIAGYSPNKEFYSPDYSQTNTTLGTDARTTLLWQPYIITNAVNNKIPITFYNNDLTKKFRIVLEGSNTEGKLIHVEKIIK